MAIRVQIICGQPIPVAGNPVTGAGLRAWALGKGLESHGVEVIYSLPADVLDKLPGSSGTLRETAFQYHRLDEVIDRVKPDILLLQGWPLAQLLTERPDIPLVIDLNGPFLLENLFSRVEPLEMMPFRKLQAFQKADFITCSGVVQRHYFLPWLLMAGYDLTADPCPPIPVSMSPDLPEPGYPEEPVFVYGGIFLPWQDPTISLRRIAQRLEQRGRGKLLIFGGPHPTFDFPTGEMPRIVQELKDHPRVDFAGMIPHETVMRRYLECSVFVELMRKNVERELAFTNRTIAALWSGLPVIYNNYSELSPCICDYDAGWTLDPEDEEALDAVVDEVLDHPERVATRKNNAQRLIRERLTWDITIRPLLEFCRKPYRRTRETSLIDQSITPLDDRVGRLMLDMKRSSVYKKLKAWRNGK